MARDLGLDLGKVQGTERGGRISLQDIRNYIAWLQQAASAGQGQSGATQEGAPAAKPPAEKIDFAKWGKVERKPMSGLRKVISQRMTESWTSIPHVTQFDEVDVTELTALIKKNAAKYEKKGAKLTLTAFTLKAVANTLQKHPIFNASMDESSQEIVYKEYCHIGLAVDTEHGLIVPVIRDVNKKSLLELSKDVIDLAKKTRDRKIGGDELKGGTFTISNQGGIGGAHFTPIINRPELAILGLGRGSQKPMVIGKKIEPRLMMPICLSYDHRLIDGGSAARFTVDLVQAFQQFTEKDL
jgi:pyruvate dehydrogenase E2 component (dihydrolipoamide acetyltransferase)